MRTWLHSTFGEDESPALLHPRLRINEADRVFAGKVDERLGLSRRPFTVSMNLGVGGNPRKRIDGAPGLRNRTVPSAFENKLILDILADGATLILDKGFQEEEMNHADALIHTARRANHVVLEISEGGDPGALPVTPPDRPLLIAFRGSVSKLAALIQVTDLYIGYDSQGHHAGAALGRDVIAVFAGYDSPEFPHRWRPLGPGVINVVCAGPGPFEEPEQEALAGRVLALSKTARQRKGGI